MVGVRGLNPHGPIARADLVIADEVSMVGEELGRDLMSFKRPVLVIGDPGQLPPPKSVGFLTTQKPDLVLNRAGFVGGCNF